MTEDKHSGAESTSPRNTGSELIWKHMQPTVPGWYWFRWTEEHHLPQCIEVFVDDRDGTLSVRFGPDPDDENYVLNYVGDWSGPIPMPLEPNNSSSIGA